MPPNRLFDIASGVNQFQPAGGFNKFLTEYFLNEASELFNEEHVHLNAATLGFLWTNTVNSRRGRRVAGEAEITARYTQMRLGKWLVNRIEKQLINWFADVPVFVVTFDAELWTENDDVGRLALFEHELYHCGQARDEFGIPLFVKSTGRPKFTIRGHDLEQFTGIIRRYGADAAGQDAVDFIRAGLVEPEIARSTIAATCGTCLV